MGGGSFIGSLGGIRVEKPVGFTGEKDRGEGRSRGRDGLCKAKISENYFDQLGLSSGIGEGSGLIYQEITLNLFLQPGEKEAKD